MHVKILGAGCSTCRSMYNDVTRIVDRNGWKIEVEYVQDITQILTYGLTSIPALVVDDKVVMIGHRGARQIEQMLRTEIDSQVS